MTGRAEIDNAAQRGIGSWGLEELVEESMKPFHFNTGMPLLIPSYPKQHLAGMACMSPIMHLKVICCVETVPRTSRRSSLIGGTRR